MLGADDEAYRYGWPVLLYPLGASLGLIVLGLGIGKKLARFPVSTVAQILEVVYGSSLLKKIASALSVISLFMVLVGQIVASRKFLFAIGFTTTSLLTTLFSPTGHFLSALLSTLFGLCSFCILKASPLPIPSEIAFILGFLSGEWIVKLRTAEQM